MNGDDFDNVDRDGIFDDGASFRRNQRGGSSSWRSPLGIIAIRAIISATGAGKRQPVRRLAFLFSAKPSDIAAVIEAHCDADTKLYYASKIAYYSRVERDKPAMAKLQQKAQSKLKSTPKSQG